MVFLAFPNSFKNLSVIRKVVQNYPRNVSWEYLNFPAKIGKNCKLLNRDSTVPNWYSSNFTCVWFWRENSNYFCWSHYLNFCAKIGNKLYTVYSRCTLTKSVFTILGTKIQIFFVEINIWIFAPKSAESNSF